MFLLDTNIVIWLLTNSNRLDDRVRNLVYNKDLKKLVSAASIWEIEIKRNKGKLKVPKGILDIVVKSNLEVLPINGEDAALAANLEEHHNDPFDRIIISQAINNKYTIITSDRLFDKYQVDLVLNS